MKILILTLVLALVAQPLQAVLCDMDSGQDSSHHTMQSEDPGHDCCDSGESGSQQGCDGSMRCGSCNANIPALLKVPKINADWVNCHSPALSTGLILPSHASPPFRPPIS